MKDRRWPITFRVYPEQRGLFYKVYVWPTLKAMRAHAKQEGRRGMMGAYAYCDSFARERIDAAGRCRVSPQMGAVHFNVKYLGSGAISHEFSHAALNWAHRVGFLPDVTEMKCKGPHCSEAEERYCGGHGEMVRQCINKLYDLKLL